MSRGRPTGFIIGRFLDLGTATLLLGGGISIVNLLLLGCALAGSTSLLWCVFTTFTIFLDSLLLRRGLRRSGIIGAGVELVADLGPGISC